MSLKHFCLAAGLIFIAAAFPARAAEEPPLALARDGYFYVGGRLTTGQIWGQVLQSRITRPNVGMQDLPPQ